MHSFSENGSVTEWTYKGCSQGLVCNETIYTDLGFRKTYVSSTCCITDLCNTDTYYARVPVAALFCESCEGNNVTCAASNLTSLQCGGVQDRCMTIQTVYVNDSSSNVVYKGCATGNLCGRQLAYNTGGPRVYTEVSCCGNKYFNHGVQAVTVNSTLTGMQCYACNETGKGECTAPITKIASCMGNIRIYKNITTIILPAMYKNITTIILLLHSYIQKYNYYNTAPYVQEYNYYNTAPYEYN
ncbi:urokinase plasminogen activator surface receptor-like [Dendrobates tinctorius]|uniref:urokinase plasminogen activator surface receptor-like n=1 Tax=Dendrobates tinctorius TaxID=92724 RepID=UPI003CC97F39